MCKIGQTLSFIPTTMFRALFTLAVSAGIAGAVYADSTAAPRDHTVVGIQVAWKELIATHDQRAQAAQSCSPGFTPIVLTQTSSGESSIDVPATFILTQGNRVLIRRGTDKVLSAADGSAATNISEARVRYGVLHRSREEEAIYQHASVDLTLYGCISPYSVQITAGSVVVNGRAEAYAIEMEETLQTLASDHDADLSIWYTTYNEALRLGSGKAYNPYPYRYRSSDDHAEIGRIRLTTKPIAWDFLPFSGEGQPLSGAIKLSVNAAVFDGGVFRATE